jgi:lipoate-protein ligase A
MAIDEAISIAVRKNLSPPTLRLYSWSDPSVSIGFFQRSSDINLTYCKQRGYPVVRRSTGGTAILHESELTYSFSVRTDIHPFRDGLLSSYLLISTALANSLKRININAEINKLKKSSRDSFCFMSSSYGEVTVHGRKIIGSAQRRYKNCLLQQGTILLDFDPLELKNVLNIRNQAADYSNTGSIRQHSPGITLPDLRGSLKIAFEDYFGNQLMAEGCTEFEHNLAKELEAEKYSTENWNMRR